MQRRTFLEAAAGALAVPSLSRATAEAAFAPGGRTEISGAKEAVVGPDAKTAFVAVTDGFAAVDIRDPAAPTVLAERRDLLADRDDGPMADVWDVKVAGDRLVVAGPAARHGGDVVQGFLLYDVSDPANPKRVAFHETDFPIHNCFVRDGHVYLTGNDQQGNPLVVVNVENDAPEEVGRWSLPGHDDRWREVGWFLRWFHDVWVAGDRAYLALWDAGTVVLDVSDPANPSFVSRVGGRSVEALAGVPNDEMRSVSLSPPGNDHYAAVDDDATLLAIGKETADPTPDDGRPGPGRVELWDIADERNPRKLAAIDPPDAAAVTDAAGRSGGPFALGFGGRPSALGASDPAALDAGRIACHGCEQSRGGTLTTTSHNFELVGDRLYTSWYEGGVKVHDISDPANPEEVASWRDPSRASFWTARRATDDTLVASSLDMWGDTVAGLYTFPAP